MKYLAELRRRNVLRAAVLYIGAAWVLAQGIAQFGPPLGAPEWITRGFLVAAAIGLPFWLAFAWFYGWTPQGLKRVACQIEEVHAFRGEADATFQWMDTAYAQHDGGFSTIKYDPFLKSLRSDPRYAAMLRKPGLPV